MKTIILFFTALLFAIVNLNALEKKSENIAHYGNSGNVFIFTECGIEFAVYQDGQFDFYLNRFRKRTSVNLNSLGINISFNSGYDYDTFVQYDDYGAVVQIENVPVFYDHYGRIIQAGDVYIRYNRWGRVSRVGGLYVNYNRYGVFMNSIGFINGFNRRYFFQPYHRFFATPNIQRCVVWNSPYRRFYAPYRFSYAVYRDQYFNGVYNYTYDKPNYLRPGVKTKNYKRGKRIANARVLKFKSREIRRALHKRNDGNDQIRNNSHARFTRKSERSTNRKFTKKSVANSVITAKRIKRKKVSTANHKTYNKIKKNLTSPRVVTKRNHDKKSVRRAITANTAKNRISQSSPSISNTKNRKIRLKSNLSTSKKSRRYRTVYFN